jgi:hypothetical protein
MKTITHLLHKDWSLKAIMTMTACGFFLALVIYAFCLWYFVFRVIYRINEPVTPADCLLFGVGYKTHKKVFKKIGLLAKK